MKVVKQIIMTALPCDFSEFTFVSAEGALAEQLLHLGFHVQTAQPQQQPVPCDFAGCNFVSAEGALADQLRHLGFHVQTFQPQPQHRGKVDRPTLQPNSNREGWDFFRYGWENHKTAMGIS